jgi:nitrite reductase (NADH) small subunit
VTWLRLGRCDRLPSGRAVRVDIDGDQVALFNTGGTFHAVDDVCPHLGGPLSEGDVEGTIVTCPWHGWRYDLCTGERVDRPGSPVRTYMVEEREGWILMEDADR